MAPTSLSSPARSHLRVHAINIYVRDQERSVRFFLDQLGFNVAFDARLHSGERWVAVAPPDGSTVLALMAPKTGTVEHKRIGRSTGVVFVTADVAAQYREWRERGVRFRNAPRLRRVRYDARDERTPIWGGVFARFEDLDRNVFELVSFDAVTEAVEARRRAAAEALERERRSAQELEIAKQVQARLFPQMLPPFNTLEYAGVCIQAKQVGGDYYDFLTLGQDRLGLVIGDIAGKGIAAALLMANLQANLRSKCATALSHPERFLQSVNRHFFENTTASAYATLFFADYDDSTRRLRYANCGHLCALLLRSNGTVERLDSTATVLGLFEEWECSIAKCRFRPGDLLALYTDGITESANADDEDFGEHGLVEALRRYRLLSPQEILSSVVEEVQKYSPHEQHDDITLIVAKCR